MPERIFRGRLTAVQAAFDESARKRRRESPISQPAPSTLLPPPSGIDIGLVQQLRADLSRSDARARQAENSLAVLQVGVVRVHHRTLMLLCRRSARTSPCLRRGPIQCKESWRGFKARMTVSAKPTRAPRRKQHQWFSGVQFWAS